MDEKPIRRTSRRALLAAAGGAAAALAAESLARPLSVAANDGDSLKLGQVNTASHKTELHCDYSPTTNTTMALDVRTENLMSAVDVHNTYGFAIRAFGTEEGATGVYAFADHGVAVNAQSMSGIGVDAASNTGLAFYAHGAVGFQTAGLGTVPIGKTRVTVTPVMMGHPLDAGAKVLVTLMTNPKGSQLSHVVVNVDEGTVSVYLTAPAKVNTRFAYFVIS